jgi:hypothetical protein
MDTHKILGPRVWTNNVIPFRMAKLSSCSIIEAAWESNVDYQLPILGKGVLPLKIYVSSLVKDKSLRIH